MVFVILIFALAGLAFYFSRSKGLENDIAKIIKKRGGEIVAIQRSGILLNYFGHKTEKWYERYLDNHTKSSSYEIEYYDVEFYEKGTDLKKAIVKIKWDAHVNKYEFKIVELIDLPDDKYEREKEEKKEIRKQKFAYKTKQGELIIEQEYYNPNDGEEAFLNGKRAPDGKYTLGIFREIEIRGGKVHIPNPEMAMSGKGFIQSRDDFWN